MSYPDIAHFDAPFVLTAKGAKVVDQNSAAEILACVQNILACPIGFRLDNPAFGAPPLQFSNVPLPVSGVQQAIQRWELRATTDIAEEAFANNQERKIDIRVESASE